MVQSVLRPVETRGPNGHLVAGGLLRVVDQIQVQSLARGGVVRTAGELDISETFEARPVTFPGISKPLGVLVFLD
jgi:hypothetical protein